MKDYYLHGEIVESCRGCRRKGGRGGGGGGGARDPYHGREVIDCPDVRNDVKDSGCDEVGNAEALDLRGSRGIISTARLIPVLRES